MQGHRAGSAGPAPPRGPPSRPLVAAERSEAALGASTESRARTTPAAFQRSAPNGMYFTPLWLVVAGEVGPGDDRGVRMRRTATVLADGMWTSLWSEIWVDGGAVDGVQLMVVELVWVSPTLVDGRL
jgi:hypothetical protein